MILITKGKALSSSQFIRLYRDAQAYGHAVPVWGSLTDVTWFCNGKYSCGTQEQTSEITRTHDIENRLGPLVRQGQKHI